MALFRALTALAEDPGLIPSIHIVTHNCLSLQFLGIPFSGLWEHKVYK